ncbi:hypothetical protein TNIN_32491 [Trichonephila inaurata madagascariensis]|uniref:Uncharacterized protein n=1 Tax=Trichonephila inaurata madagascariensis TaxID=2747483 RepID=A0A8X6XL79_9ARAC|nr:hypothetical protein TNIN_32491 [Trichonephila inaurata madagascariensis]
MLMPEESLTFLNYGLRVFLREGLGESAELFCARLTVFSGSVLKVTCLIPYLQQVQQGGWECVLVCPYVILQMFSSWGQSFCSKRQARNL